jgi:heptosyltransferase-2
LDERFHYVRRYLQLLGEPGKEINAADFYFPRADHKDVDALFSQGKTDARRLLAVAPGSRAGARRWFPERFADVLNGLDSSWTGLVLLGAPEDVPFVDQVAARVKKPLIHLCGKTSLPLAAAVLERCAALLTNESGLMHVGWAVGTPLVVVAGPSEPHATSPFGPNVRIIQHREIPCVPCVKNTCYRFGEEENLCLKMISSAEVLTALTRPLHGKPIPDRER